MEIAPEAVEVPPDAPQRRFRATENPIVRAIGRVPLPLGAKLLIGFVLVAGLLAVSAVLGLRALSQSNSRGAQLRRLQQEAVFEQRLLGDATQLQSVTGQLVYAPNSSPLHGVVGGDVAQLCADVVARVCGGAEGVAAGGGEGLAAGVGLSLARIDPALFREVDARLKAFNNLTYGNGIGPSTASSPATVRAAVNAASDMTLGFQTLATKTKARANALVAQDHSSFQDSRDLLIGFGGGSFLLAIALGLLLSWSVVVPLRRTQERLSEIAGGDFAGHIEVPNRDEIGALAADVNRMNDELGHLYRELEAASRHKSDFLATMSHELRTPLNAIIGFSEVLHEQMFGELNERQIAYVHDVLEAGKHLLSLINDVLDLAKIEAGRMELQLSEVAVPDVLSSALSMHSESAGRNGIALTVTTDPAEIEITADERRVRQIVFNLLSNAVKFTPADGRVDVSARVEDGHVEIAVADTGPGIPAEDLEMIFEEFEQTVDGRKKEEGTGLGLPLSRKLVELHGGRLWVESEVGHGSTFRFTLPVEARG
jgi:signal transduction histidine kinase